LDAPAEILATLWDQLVEASIAYEMTEFDRLKA
jgi:isochorismate pyruvate lyase